jgi:hypothetical protein
MARKKSSNNDVMKKAEDFVRRALAATSSKRVSDAKVRAVAKKVSRALPENVVHA